MATLSRCQCLSIRSDLLSRSLQFLLTLYPSPLWSAQNIELIDDEVIKHPKFLQLLLAGLVVPNHLDFISHLRPLSSPNSSYCVAWNVFMFTVHYQKLQKKTEIDLVFYSNCFPFVWISPKLKALASEFTVISWLNKNCSKWSDKAPQDRRGNLITFTSIGFQQEHRKATVLSRVSWLYIYVFVWEIFRKTRRNFAIREKFGNQSLHFALIATIFLLFCWPYFTTNASQ